jgi:hypothetical protein
MVRFSYRLRQEKLKWRFILEMYIEFDWEKKF